MLKAALLAAALAGAAIAQIKPVTLPQLFARVNQPANDTLYVVNFWATWCKPCVAEMPYFRQVPQTFAGQPVKVVFVSLNSPREQATVQKFADSNHLTDETLLLNAGNPNNWIDSIDPTWSGAIPATAMYRKGQKVFFYEGEFTPTMLDSIIKTKL